MTTGSDPRRRLPQVPGQVRSAGISVRRPGRRTRRGPAFDRRAVSELTATRLSAYVRCLAALEAEGLRHISSKEFARRFGFHPPQIRRDLATFGEFGVRGVGYEVSELRKHLTSILGLDRTWRLAVIGAGHLGQALADYSGFRSGGFTIAALLDRDAAKIGTKTRAGVEVRDVADLAEIVSREKIQIGVLAVPATEAAAVARRCVQAGLKAILNFAPVRLSAPAGVRLKNVDLKVNLETLAFYAAAD